jgi:hypothetical protein
MESIDGQIKHDLDLKNQDSHISNVILELALDKEEPNRPGGIKAGTLTDLLVMNEDGSKVAVRITATDLESLTPLLEELDFEVLVGEELGRGYFLAVNK